MLRKSMCLCTLSPVRSQRRNMLVQYKIVVIFEIPLSQFFCKSHQPTLLVIASSFSVPPFPHPFCTPLRLPQPPAWTPMQGLSLNASTHPLPQNLSQNPASPLKQRTLSPLVHWNPKIWERPPKKHPSHLKLNVLPMRPLNNPKQPCPLKTSSSLLVIVLVKRLSPPAHIRQKIPIPPKAAPLKR